MPSFTIAVTFFFSARRDADGEVHRDAAAGRNRQARPRDRARRRSSRRLSAETKLVLSGTGSVIVTPVASALPMFFSVIV